MYIDKNLYKQSIFRERFDNIEKNFPLFYIYNFYFC